MEEIAREILPRLTLGNLWEHLVQGRPQQQRLRGRRRPQQGMIINRTTNPEIKFLYFYLNVTSLNFELRVRFPPRARSGRRQQFLLFLPISTNL